MSLSDARGRLAAAQADFVRALTGTAPPPPGFDPGRLRAAAAALAQKRLRAVKRAWPALSSALGESLAGLFSAYAAAHPLPSQGGPLADGWAFARMLVRQGQLPEAGRLELLAVELRHTAGPDGLVPRRGLAVRAALLRRPYRWVVALRLPWRREYWLTLPLSRN